MIGILRNIKQDQRILVSIYITEIKITSCVLGHKDGINHYLLPMILQWRLCRKVSGIVYVLQFSKNVPTRQDIHDWRLFDAQEYEPEELVEGLDKSGTISRKGRIKGETGPGSFAGPAIRNGSREQRQTTQSGSAIHKLHNSSPVRIWQITLTSWYHQHEHPCLTSKIHWYSSSPTTRIQDRS